MDLPDDRFGIFFDRSFEFGTYLSAIVISILCGVVMSGVPGGGLIGEALLMSIYGFPPSAYPIIVTIGFLIDAPATMINSVATRWPPCWWPALSRARTG